MRLRPASGPRPGPGCAGRPTDHRPRRPRTWPSRHRGRSRARPRAAASWPPATRRGPWRARQRLLVPARAFLDAQVQAASRNWLRVLQAPRSALRLSTACGMSLPSHGPRSSRSAPTLPSMRSRPWPSAAALRSNCAVSVDASGRRAGRWRCAFRGVRGARSASTFNASPEPAPSSWPAGRRATRRVGLSSTAGRFRGPTKAVAGASAGADAGVAPVALPPFAPGRACPPCRMPCRPCPSSAPSGRAPPSWAFAPCQRWRAGARPGTAGNQGPAPRATSSHQAEQPQVRQRAQLGLAAQLGLSDLMPTRRLAMPSRAVLPGREGGGQAAERHGRGLAVLQQMEFAQRELVQRDIHRQRRQAEERLVARLFGSRRHNVTVTADGSSRTCSRRWPSARQSTFRPRSAISTRVPPVSSSSRPRSGRAAPRPRTSNAWPSSCCAAVVSSRRVPLMPASQNRKPQASTASIASPGSHHTPEDGAGSRATILKTRSPGRNAVAGCGRALAIGHVQEQRARPACARAHAVTDRQRHVAEGFGRVAGIDEHPCPSAR